MVSRTETEASQEDAGRSPFPQAQPTTLSAPCHDDATRAGFLEAEVQFLDTSAEYRNDLQKVVKILAD
jgi:hypothetical protein